MTVRLANPALDAFLDEGFGTLDSDTLEVVAETLENLGPLRLSRPSQSTAIATEVAEESITPRAARVRPLWPWNAVPLSRFCFIRLWSDNADGKATGMHALQYTRYGGPEVLSWAEAPEPHARPGQVRISVRAASVNPVDWKTFSGAIAGGRPMSGVGYLGRDGCRCGG